MSYRSICSAHDWFFVARTEYGPVVYPLAAWALSESGEIFGLTAINHPVPDGKRPPFLMSVPPIPGKYLLRESLTDEELTAAFTHPSR